MNCLDARDTLSSLLDLELGAPPDPALSAHVRSCEPCRDFIDHARDLDRLARSLGGPAPDVSAAVIDSVRADRARRRYALWTASLRLGLVAVAAAQLALAMPGLLFGSDEGAPIHVAHEVGAWDLALAVGFVYAAWRPLRALGLLPVVAALTAALALTAVIDVAHGRAVVLTETAHLLELVGSALLYLLVVPRLPRRKRAELHAV